MITPTIVAVLCTSLSRSATQPQLDPDKPGSYILSKADLVLIEKAKTLNPMYETWSRALRTQSNTIIPNSASNPENVKRAERVFGEYE